MSLPVYSIKIDYFDISLSNFAKNTNFGWSVPQISHPFCVGPKSAPVSMVMYALVFLFILNFCIAKKAHCEFMARFISKFQKHYFCKDLTFFGTSSFKRRQEAHKSLKKAEKGCKGHFKGQRIKKWKNIDFIAFLCSFGVKNEEDSVF